jgi:YggT family protein
MLAQLLDLVLGWLCDFLSFAFLTRFAMQWARAPFRNPIGQFVVAVTDWAVRPVRKVVPGLFGLDLPSFLLAWLTQLLYFLVMIGLAGGYGAAPAALVMALFATLRLGVYLAMGVIIVAALLSWINPYAPMAPLFNQLSAPLLRPIQRLVPPIGGLDLSPLFVLLLLQALLIVLGYLHMSLLPLPIS